MMKKTKLLILLSVAMLFMGKANLCSNTYATDDENELTLENRMSKDSFEVSVEDDALKDDSYVSNKLSKLIGQGILFKEENVDKDNLLESMTVKESEELISNFIAKLNSYKFLEHIVGFTNQKVSEVKLDDFIVIYNNLLMFTKDVLQMYGELENLYAKLIEKYGNIFVKGGNIPIKDRIKFKAEGAKYIDFVLLNLVKPLEEKNSNLFYFKFCDKFLRCLHEMFTGTTGVRLKNCKKFQKVMLAVLSNMKKFIRFENVQNDIQNDVLQNMLGRKTKRLKG